MAGLLATTAAVCTSQCCWGKGINVKQAAVSMGGGLVSKGGIHSQVRKHTSGWIERKTWGDWWWPEEDPCLCRASQNTAARHGD